MIKKTAVILGIGLLVGCSDTSVSTEPKEAPKPTISAPATPEKTVEIPDIKADIEKYNQMIQGPVNGLQDSLQTFADLSTEAGEDPYIMLEDDWKTDMAMTLTLMEEYIGQMKEITPPEGLEEVHNLLLQGMDKYQYVVDNFPTAIDNMDPDMINDCATAMAEGTGFIAQASAKLTSMK